VSVLEAGKSVASYVVAGLVVALVIGVIIYGITLFVKTTASALSAMYEAGVDATGGGQVEYVQLQVGNETVDFPRPSNQALSSIADTVLKVLIVVANALAHPVTLATLIALTLIAYAIMERS